MTTKSNKQPLPLIFRYINWEGKTGVRRVIPYEIYWGETQWHPQEQWLLRALDLDKNEERTFAMKDILEFYPKESQIFK